MESYVTDSLKGEQQSEFHKTILADSKKLVEMSRRRMRVFYDQWDKNDDIYRGIIRADEQDKKARERREPEKMVVPISYSQVQTFVSFCFSLFTQRERFFELLGMSEEDQEPAKIGEAFLARDLSYNIFEARLYQFLLDVARFGMGIVKTSWTRETQQVSMPVAIPPTSPFQGVQEVPQVQAYAQQTVTKYLGNKILNISPYRFFPDVRLPLCRFQEGEFVASEDEYSYTALMEMQNRGEVSGVEFTKGFSIQALEARGNWHHSMGLSMDEAMTQFADSAQSKGNRLVTEVQRSIIPSEYMVDDKPLGPEKYPVKYVVWYVNDQRVIKCEPMNYLHGQFTYDVAEYAPDFHNLVNMGLSETIDSLQSVISWFINSRITSVRKVISNYLIVDPEGVEMKDLQARNPVIRLKPLAAARGGIDRVVKQLNIQDVTQNHLADAKFLQDMVQLTTGISDNLLGQFHTGRRSATEARNVNSSAAARLKMIATLIFRGALEPMGRKMLSNLRDGLDEKTVVNLVGADKAMGADFIKADKEDLVGNYDFEVFDGTLPSEKVLIAQALQEVLTALIPNPQAAVALQIDPRAMLMEQLELRGVRNPERFTLAPPPTPGMPGNVTPLTQPPALPAPSQPYEPGQSGLSGLFQGGPA